MTPGSWCESGASPWSSTCWSCPLKRQQVPCGPAVARVRSLRWLRRCQGCRMEGINVPTCPAQLLPPLEGGSCSADRNPTGPWGLHHFIPTRSDLTNSPFQSICIRGSCPKCWSFLKFSLCNQSSSLKQPVNSFSSLSPPQQSWFWWVYMDFSRG